MAYSETAAARRRCTGSRADGQPCGAWAVWGDARQLCVQHAGRGHRGPYDTRNGLLQKKSERTHAEPCRCAAYAWPHRPASGVCRWPEPPIWRCTTPAGRRAGPRRRH